MELIFRKIQNNERSALVELYKHLNSNDPILIEDNILNKKWNEFLADTKISCLIVENNNEILASCTLIIIPKLTRGARPYGLIENVVTNKNYRNKGIGTRLLKFALSQAWKADCYKVMLLLGRKEDETLRFYEKAGFKRGVKTGFVAYPD